ncbi:MAG: dTDP-glucose 4,6-dehydratase [Actinomycetes bacterium]|jgi:dTDP-glucose 4,6-dehydratase|nr:MAG: dTDP-glucose 4,6-dehydratase [Actinomycetota bacterium]
MSRRYLVTGGAGFIGSNFVRTLLVGEPDSEVVNLDLMTYAGVPATVAELDEYPNHRFVKGDIRDEALVAELMQGVDVVVHFAAESHVDRSIAGPGPFISTNVLGTAVLLDAALRASVGLFLHVSTDEVYGSIAEGFAPETAPLNPSSPYSSSKASSDLIALSYHHTYGFPVIVTRCTNNYGPYQFPEKVIPLFVTNLIDGKKVPLYGEGLNERDWLHVSDHCAAIRLLLEKGTPGEVYNIGADNQLANIELTRRILSHFGLDESWIERVPDRPGHDFRYAVDSSKLRSLGWAPAQDFDERLEETIAWYRAREDWWRPLKEKR